MGEPDNRPLVLTVSLIPKPNWGKDLAKLLPKRTWEQLRKQVYAQADHRCVLCGAPGSLHADEVWEFDEENVVQKLISIRAICPDCHACKHWGHTSRVSPPRKIGPWALQFTEFLHRDMLVGISDLQVGVGGRPLLPLREMVEE